MARFGNDPRAAPGSGAAVGRAYGLLIVQFNAAAGYSYDSLGPPHAAEPAVLRYFGPWPLRVVSIVLTGLRGMALLTLPWPARRNAAPARGVTSGAVDDRARTPAAAAPAGALPSALA